MAQTDQWLHSWMVCLKTVCDTIKPYDVKLQKWCDGCVTRHHSSSLVVTLGSTHTSHKFTHFTHSFKNCIHVLVSLSDESQRHSDWHQIEVSYLDEWQVVVSVGDCDWNCDLDLTPKPCFATEVGLEGRLWLYSCWPMSCSARRPLTAFRQSLCSRSSARLWYSWA